MDAEKRVELLIKLKQAEDEIERIDAIKAKYPAYVEARELNRTQQVYRRYCRMIRNQLDIQQLALFTTNAGLF